MVIRIGTINIVYWGKKKQNWWSVLPAFQAQNALSKFQRIWFSLQIVQILQLFNWWRFVLSNSQVKNFVIKDSVGLLGQTRRHKYLASHTVFYSRSFHGLSATVCCPILKISFIYIIILNKLYLDTLAVGCFEDLDCAFQVLFAKMILSGQKKPTSHLYKLPWQTWHSSPKNTIGKKFQEI